MHWYVFTGWFTIKFVIDCDWLWTYRHVYGFGEQLSWANQNIQLTRMTNNLHRFPFVSNQVLLLVVKPISAAYYPWRQDISVTLCVSHSLQLALFSSPLLIDFIFLYSGRELLYQSTGLLLWWIPHSGFWNDLPAACSPEYRILLQRISSAQCISSSPKDFSFHGLVTWEHLYMNTMNSLLREALYKIR